MANPTMTAVGTVETAINSVTAVNRNGETRELQTGSPVFRGDTIKTGNESLVGIQLNNGNRFDLGRNSEATLDADVLGVDAEEARAEAVLEAQSIQDDLLAQLESGADPTQLFEATAAGGQPAAGGNDNGTGDSADAPVVIDRTGAVGDVNAGYDTTPQSTTFPEQPQPIEEIVEPSVSVTVNINVKTNVTVDNPDEPTPPYVPEDFPGGPSGKPSVSGNAASVLELTDNGLEGDADDWQQVTFILKLSDSFNSDVVVTYQLLPVDDGDGSEYGVDWKDGSLDPQQITIPAGSLEVPVTVEIRKDHLDEGNGTFKIVLLEAQNATIDPTASSATVTIFDDDTTPVADDDANSIDASDYNFDDEELEISISGYVLENDSDEDGSALSVKEPVSIENQFGTLTINTDGTYKFELNGAGIEKLQSLVNDETFPITFPDAYQVTDGYNPGNFADLTIYLIGSNQPPTITTDSGEPEGANDVVYESGLENGSQVEPVVTTVSGTMMVKLALLLTVTRLMKIQPIMINRVVVLMVFRIYLP